MASNPPDADQPSQLPRKPDAPSGSSPDSDSGLSTKSDATLEAAPAPEESRGSRKRKHDPEVPRTLPSITPGRSYLASSQVQDIAPLRPESSYFPYEPLRSSGTLRPEQYRHIRTTYAFARYLLDEEYILPEVFRIPLGYIRQLLYCEGISIDPTDIMPLHDDPTARDDADVLPTFPGMPLEQLGFCLSPIQFEHVEETYCHFVTDVEKTCRQCVEDMKRDHTSFRFCKEEYEYILFILGQLIHHHRGDEEWWASRTKSVKK